MKNKDVLLLSQLTLCIFLIASLIASLFEKELFNLMKSIAGLTFIVMSVNNHLIYKRKYITFIYALFGIILIVLGCLGAFNG